MENAAVSGHCLGPLGAHTLLLADLELCIGLQNQGLSKQLERVQDESVFGFGGGEPEGGSGRGRRAELHRQAVAALALLSVEGTSVVPAGRLATIAGDGGRRLAALTYGTAPGRLGVAVVLSFPWEASLLPAVPSRPSPVL